MVSPYIFPLQYSILLQLLQIFLDFVCIDECFMRFGTRQRAFQARRQRRGEVDDSDEFCYCYENIKIPPCCTARWNLLKLSLLLFGSLCFFVAFAFQRTCSNKCSCRDRDCQHQHGSNLLTCGFGDRTVCIGVPAVAVF